MGKVYWQHECNHGIRMPKQISLVPGLPTGLCTETGKALGNMTFQC